MTTYSTHTDEDSDFGPTVPGHRSGEGSGSILPYLANSLKVNPNAGALSLARELRAASESKQKKRPQTDSNSDPAAPLPPATPVKSSRT
jgi:hypothetical protein